MGKYLCGCMGMYKRNPYVYHPFLSLVSTHTHTQHSLPFHLYYSNCSQQRPIIHTTFTYTYIHTHGLLSSQVSRSLVGSIIWRTLRRAASQQPIMAIQTNSLCSHNLQHFSHTQCHRFIKLSSHPMHNKSFPSNNAPNPQDIRDSLCAIIVILGTQLKILLKLPMDLWPHQQQ